MKKNFTYIIILIFLTSFLQACASYRHDPWTKEDTYRHVVITGLTIIDWQQTLETAANPDQYYERNFFLGDHPSKSEVDQYFLLTYIAGSGITYLLPEPWRKYWQHGWIGVSFCCVANNYSIGLTGQW